MENQTKSNLFIPLLIAVFILLSILSLFIFANPASEIKKPISINSNTSSSSSSTTQSSERTQSSMTTKDGKLQFEFDTIELARTPKEREIGYMNRPEICYKCGMLFIFDDSQPQSFWMKNTLVPLRITFMDENGVVINTEIGYPSQEKPAINSLKPAKYVLEVPLESKILLSPGQVVDIDFMVIQATY